MRVSGQWFRKRKISLVNALVTIGMQQDEVIVRIFAAEMPLFDVVRIPARLERKTLLTKGTTALLPVVKILQ